MTVATPSRFVAAAAAVTLAFAVSACTSEEPAPLPTVTASAPPSAIPNPDPTLRPDGSALQNLDYFEFVLTAAVDDGARTGGAFVDALASAGFDRSAMEVTADRTTVNLDADSVQFSVLINDTCLVGQYGDAMGLHVAALPALATGTCLIGETESVG